MTAPPPAVDAVGLLLAAGAGRRLGTPKATLVDASGTPLLHRCVGVLRAAGLPVTVVLGASAETAAGLLPVGVDVVVADDWAEGMGASLRTGLRHLCEVAAPRVHAAVVSLVDLPDVGPSVVGRLMAAWRETAAGPEALARATYDGRPGHPVLLGRDHWEPLAEVVHGDVGAQRYLSGRRVLEVSCEDLATGHDVDEPGDLHRLGSPDDAAGGIGP